MHAERDLATLLATLSPELQPGRYVFTTTDGGPPAGAAPVVTVDEHEGRTLVLTQDEADALGLPYDLAVAWITLSVHSALDAVGLTAAVATRLAEAGIACNVVAGYHHDHLFVPVEQAGAALAALAELTGSAPSCADDPG